MARRTTTKTRATRKRRGGGGLPDLPFKDVDTSGGAFKIPDGDYRMKLVEAELGESSNDNPMITWVFQGLEGKAKGKKFRFWTVLTVESLWKLAQLTDALGVDRPDSVSDLDLEEIVESEPEIVGTVQLGEDREGRERSQLVSVDSADGESDEEDEEEEEEEAPRSRRGAKRKASRREEPEEEEDEEEEEEEQPRRRGKKKALETLNSADVRGMDEEELEDVINKHDLDVDLSQYKTPRKKQQAVVEALDEAGLLGE